MYNCNSFNLTSDNSGKDDSSQPNSLAILTYVSVPFAFLFFVCYSLTLYVICANVKELGNYAYTTCLVTIGVFDMLLLIKLGLFDLFVDLNTVSVEMRIYSWTLLGSLNYGQLCTTTLTSINRVVSVVFWKQYDQLFTVKRSVMYEAVAALIGIVIPLPLAMPGVGHILTKKCVGPSARVLQWFFVYDAFLTFVLINGNMGIYLGLFIFLRRTRKSPGNANIDRKILLQSFFIVLFHFVIWIVLILNLLPVPFPASIHHALITKSALMNAGMNPFLYYTFWSAFRKLVTRKFGSHQVTTTQVVAVSLQPTIHVTNTLRM